MGRIVAVNRPVTWRNPLKGFEPSPYLDGPVFPLQRETPVDRKAHETFLRFFTPERATGEIDARALQQFLRRPGKYVFIVWGDIGIGKSWFVRHQLYSAYKERPDQIRYEVIDMLRASKSNAKEQLEQQIIVALEHYLSSSFGSWERGVRPYAEHQAKMRYGPTGTAQEISLETKRIVNEILSLAGSERAQKLLDVVETVEGPKLFIAVDNLDRALDAEQNALTDLVARMLRNAQIHLIFPLRASSGILVDEGKVLGFFEKQEMQLSPLSFKAMLIPRFNMSESGEDLRAVRVPLGLKDSSETTTFPQLLEMFLSSESSTFVMDLAGTNARQLLDFVHRIIYSNQLDSVRNLIAPEACVAALLMHDSGSVSSETSYLINLFDDNRPDEPGNALIRFRVLEFFKETRSIGPTEQIFTYYFERLGYSFHRIKSVLGLFVGARLLKTEPALTADQFAEAKWSDIEQVERIDANVNQYFDKLLRSPWYFICAKRSIHISERFISKGEDGKEAPVSDVNFVRFLKEEEDQERRRIDAWKQRAGKLGYLKDLRQPWQMARDSFGLRDRAGSGHDVQQVKDETRDGGHYQ